MSEQQHIKNLKVAIQGGYGAFHDIAAREFFTHKKLEIVPCDTFPILFDALIAGDVDCALMAIENTVAGSLMQNYVLLRDNKMEVLGEIYLHIEQNLVALSGQTIADIKEIESHPIAISQCADFLTPLRRDGIRIVESIDTALSAKKIKEENLKGVAAIASRLAAQLYGLNIIANGIESDKRNFTRFLVIANPTRDKEIKMDVAAHVNKASLSLILHDEEGILAKVLSELHVYKINMTKIQSVPVLGQDDQYQFYIDVVFDDYTIYKSALNAITPLTKELEILGEYVKGTKAS